MPVITASVRRSLRPILMFGASCVAIAANSAFAQDHVLIPGDLVISSTQYQDVGAVAGLVAGKSQLAGSVSKSGVYTPVTAVSDGNYLSVWNNEAKDGSFGVTAAITLQTVSKSGAVVNSLGLDPNQVATSFSSKSELSLNINYTPSGSSVTFMGYAGAGVGALDVSNSDAPGIPDSTNPVTRQFGSGYGFARTIVNVGANGGVSYTPTQAYGGNNGRSALIGANGLYYTVGNSNNGNSTTSNPITNSTGLEVFTPINAANAVGTAPESPAEVDPSYTPISGDKYGKSNNYRGLTSYDGQLYFTKGSGSNGMDTVYTVKGGLPDRTGAASSTISVLPGFPTSAARTAPDYTPFGLFFANSTTLYVADEGSGDSIDQTLHAGLEKWSLVNGDWVLDYTLQSGLIGQSYTVCDSLGKNCYSPETTTGLRDIAGTVNADGTVSIWGVTSDSSASVDNGADPNEVVAITDRLGSTSLPTDESFSVLEGPVYGNAYRGVAYDEVPEPTSLLILGSGFGLLASLARRRRKPVL